MQHRFSPASYRKLLGVRPELVAVATLALDRSITDFRITEGLRTLSRQQQLVREGASRTLNSRHLTGHAIDVVALVGGVARWDWPYYVQIASAFKSAAEALGVAIVWGGDWENFRDGPHFELHRKVYPDTVPAPGQDAPRAA